MGKFINFVSGNPHTEKIVALTVAVVIGIVATVLIVKILRRVLKRSNRVDDAIVTFLVNAVKAICIILLVTIFLQALGVSMSTIIAVLGAAGAAIALALKDSLANVAGGFMIIVTHPFNKGDIISVGNDRGVVENIDLFLTTLRTLDRKTITIPNGIINTSVVYNETNRDIRRIDCRFSVAYGSDIEKVKEILYNICEASEYILNSPEPVIGAGEYADSGIMVDCLAFCKSENYYDGKYYLYETVEAAFREAGIDIPYPRVDVKLKK